MAEARRNAAEAVVARCVGDRAGHRRRAAVGAAHQVQGDAGDAAVGGQRIERVVAVQVDVDRAADRRDAQFTKQVAGGLLAGGQGHRADAVVHRSGIAASGAGGLAPVDEAARRGRNAAFNHRVAAAIGGQQAVDAPVAAGICGGAAVHRIAQRVGAGDGDRHVGDAHLAGVLDAVVGLGGHAGAVVLVDGAGQRRGQFTEAVVGRAACCQQRDGDAVAARRAIGIAVAVASGLGLAQQIALAGHHVVEAVAAVGAGGSGLQRGAAGAISALHQAHHHIGEAAGVGAAQCVVAVSVHIDQAADAGQLPFTKVELRAVHASAQVDAGDAVGAGGRCIGLGRAAAGAGGTVDQARVHRAVRQVGWAGRQRLFQRVQHAGVEPGEAVGAAAVGGGGGQQRAVAGVQQPHRGIGDGQVNAGITHAIAVAVDVDEARQRRLPHLGEVVLRGSGAGGEHDAAETAVANAAASAVAAARSRRSPARCRR
ncbi:MAG: hypothetical protein QE285_12665 [Aquabacterium sp.]|nr:hypothetical protein [Aquabacterium sp.]